MGDRKKENKKKSFSSIPDKLLVSDLAAESVGGGTNAATALGNGKLTVGISPWGELIYFRWPYLSISDHLRYFTQRKGIISNFAPQDVRWGHDAPCYDWFRYGRPKEPISGLGAKFCIGLSDKSVMFLDDPIWTSSREYLPKNGGVLTTSLKSEQISIEIIQGIHPTADLMVQQIHPIEYSGGIDWIGFYACFNPRIGGEFGMGKADPRLAGFY
jgi:hypothetical protein